ncbi:membrane protein [Devosia yakushimensis]|uniref:Membrane protein n=1 Tax=Devosia yakushimensis TaxID=470028 RepID=A0ABQ5UF70_9HYPH|nr:DUF998 domain-containing protein [Devosia yakushimensis]GLQ10288.1 membrane protein [Devosia yakushimensis]
MAILYLLAALLYLAVLVLFGLLHVRGGYSPIRHAVSDYGVGPTRSLFAAYASAGIVAALLLGAAILAGGQFPVRGGLYLLAMAAFRLGVLAFPTDIEGERLTRNGKLHYGFAIASFALTYMAIDVLHPIALPLVADWARWVLSGLRWAVTLSLGGVVICLIPALRRVFGLFERIYLLSTALWLGILASAMA